jgi:uncharacterized protein
MARLSDVAREIINEAHPGWVATADQSGQPNVSAKGSFRVLDEEHVMFADVASPRTIANLTENPLLSAVVYDPLKRRGCRIWGRAEVLSSGELMERVKRELAERKMEAKHVVVIFVDDYMTF